MKNNVFNLAVLVSVVSALVVQSPAHQEGKRDVNEALAAAERTQTVIEAIVVKIIAQISNAENDIAQLLHPSAVAGGVMVQNIPSSVGTSSTANVVALSSSLQVSATSTLPQSASTTSASDSLTVTNLTSTASTSSSISAASSSSFIAAIDSATLSLISTTSTTSISISASSSSSSASVAFVATSTTDQISITSTPSTTTTTSFASSSPTKQVGGVKFVAGPIDGGDSGNTTASISPDDPEIIPTFITNAGPEETPALTEDIQSTTFEFSMLEPTQFATTISYYSSFFPESSFDNYQPPLTISTTSDTTTSTNTDTTSTVTNIDSTPTPSPISTSSISDDSDSSTVSDDSTTFTDDITTTITDDITSTTSTTTDSTLTSTPSSTSTFTFNDDGDAEITSTLETSSTTSNDTTATSFTETSSTTIDPLSTASPTSTSSSDDDSQASTITDASSMIFDTTTSTTTSTDDITSTTSTTTDSSLTSTPSPTSTTTFDDFQPTFVASTPISTSTESTSTESTSTSATTTTTTQSPPIPTDSSLIVQVIYSNNSATFDFSFSSDNTPTHFLNPSWNYTCQGLSSQSFSLELLDGSGALAGNENGTIFVDSAESFNSSISKRDLSFRSMYSSNLVSSRVSRRNLVSGPILWTLDCPSQFLTGSFDNGEVILCANSSNATDSTDQNSAPSSLYVELPNSNIAPCANGILVNLSLEGTGFYNMTSTAT